MIVYLILIQSHFSQDFQLQRILFHLTIVEVDLDCFHVEFRCKQELVNVSISKAPHLILGFAVV